MNQLESTKQALAQPDAPPSLEAIIVEAAKDFGQVLPNHMKPERIVRIALTCIRKTPGLDQCTPASFLGALMTSAQLGIEPIAGRAYLLPFYNSKKKADGTWHKVREAEFVLGYKGLVELFFRHEKAVQLDWGVVHEKDDFSYELGTSAFLRHKPSKEASPIMGYWVMATLTNGGHVFKYMTAMECMEHAREHSKTYDPKIKDFYDNSPWRTNPEAMCLKTVLVQLGKILPLSITIQRAIEADETSREYREGVSDALDLRDTVTWNEPKIEEIEMREAPPEARDVKK
jgi:recombination protein RecT